MITPVKVFVDSDVVISSLISSEGAAYLLLNQVKLPFWISNLSQAELEIVAKRLKLDKSKLDQLIEDKLKVVKIKKKLEQIKGEFGDYTKDPNDAHIIAGATEAKVRFLISYNIKHYKVERIKQDFDIVVTTPAKLLQYLRSQ